MTPINDEAGTVAGFTTAAPDPTADPRRADSMFRDLLESAPDAMVIVAPDGRIVLANAQADQMFGYRREDLIGKQVEMLIPSRHRGVHEGHRTSFFDNPEARPMGIGLQLWGLHRSGDEFPIEVSLSPIRTDREVLVSAAIRDATAQLAIQADLAEARATAEVFAERERIAGELQDSALQRVFAVGLALQSLVPRAGSSDIEQRLNDAIDDLHAVVQDFRAAIFGLRNESTDNSGLRQRLNRIISSLSGDVTTSVQYKGPLSVVGPALAEQAEAFVTEAIGNAVRRAEATKITVAINVADELRIDVVDNGKGMPDNIAGSGLVNLRERVESIGGTLSIDAGTTCGTRLRWAAPLY